MFHPRLAQTGALTLAILSCTGAAHAQTPTQGPDVIVGDLPDAQSNAPIGIGGVTYDAFAVGTTSCNKGNTPLLWFTGGTDNRHPAISQNLFRFSSATGRFEQLGQGGLKHGFTALQGSTCTSAFGFGCTATGGTTLGVGCSDPYGAGLNNNPGGMGPKWQVNASTGLFPYPYPILASSGPVRVRLSDINSGGLVGNRFFIEGQYVCGDDAAANGGLNKFNNASWREVTISNTSPGAPQPQVPNATDFSIGIIATTHREQPAIYAWQSIDPTVTISTFDVPGDGRFILAYKVSGPVAGLYTYEYALHNLNSHRCAGSVVVPLPGTQNALTGIGFHDVEAPGEPNFLVTPANPASDDWTVSGGAANSTSVAWAGPTYAGTPPIYTPDPVTTFKVLSFTPGTGNDHTANVLRWGTMFNFRFVSELAPGPGAIAVGLWRPGTGTAFTLNAQTPGGATVGNLTAACCTAGVCSVATQGACGAGTWNLPGSTCTPDPCVLGTCCLNGICSSTTSPACNGTWSVGGVCNPNPCPIPLGACCAASTCASTPLASCSGAWQGPNTTCGAVFCPAGNNLCANAIALCAGVSASSTTVGATQDGTASCAASSATPDVWYSYIPATTGSVTVDTCTASYDTALSIRTGACPGTGELACDDDSCGSLHSRLTAIMTAGTRYLIRVSGFSGSVGTFSVLVTGGGGQGCNPPGACCAGAGTCTTSIQSACTGGSVWTSGGSCSPNICPQPSGACCNGTVCSTSTLAACAGSFQGNSSACGVAGNPTTCCPINFNLVNGVTVDDIFDFLNAWFALDPRTDFNHVNGITVDDIFDFLNAWFTGC